MSPTSRHVPLDVPNPDDHLEDDIQRLPDRILQALAKATYSFTHRGRTRNGRYKHRYRYVNGFRGAANIELLRLLDADGFFGYFCTNHGHFIYFHQIIYFYCKGGFDDYHKLNRTCAKGEVECHHMDGNTLNNHPKNLTMLSPADHREVTMRQRGICPRRIDRHRLPCDPALRTQFNRRGKPIKNHDHFLANIVAQTLLLTNQWLRNCKGYIKDMVQWYGSYVARLKLTLTPGIIPDTSYLPNPTFVRLVTITHDINQQQTPLSSPS